MTLLSKIGSPKLSLVTGEDNDVVIDLFNDDVDGNTVALTSGHEVVGSLVDRDVTIRFAGPFTFLQDADDPFKWGTVIPRVLLDSGVLVNPAAPDTLFRQEITRERSLCYLQLHVTGPALNEPYLLDTHLQKGFVS